MKRLLTILVVSVSLVLVTSPKNTASAQVGVGVQIGYQDFYDQLSPYGRWMEYPDYGYVWMPNVGADFRPYSTNGHWVWSDEYEWMWVSDYSWGWAPFHYGRWFQDPMYGWMWMPGYEWAPAWVAWRDGGDYYGWAPLRPGISIGVNFSFGSYNPPIDYWCFAPRRYISSPRIYNYCLPARQNVTIINNTTIINNYGRRGNNIFVNGPRRGDAERYAGRIRSVRFRDVNSPGRARVRNNEVSFYRPSIQRDNNRNIAPRNFDRYNNRNGQNNGNAGRDNAVRDNQGTGWRQNNPRRDNDNAGTGWSQNNPRTRANDNRNDRVNTSPVRDNNNNNEGTGWRQNNPRTRNNDNNGTGWRQNNPRNNDNNNRVNENNRANERRDILQRQPVNRQPERQVFERRQNNNNDAQRRMNVERPSRQSAPQINRDRPMRQMENRPSMNRDRGGEQRGGGGRRRD